MMRGGRYDSRLDHPREPDNAMKKIFGLTLLAAGTLVAGGCAMQADDSGAAPMEHVYTTGSNIPRRAPVVSSDSDSDAGQQNADRVINSPAALQRAPLPGGAR